ncbi:MAG: ABC-F family ATP-binding cassette domain-containing protein [Firmicutes bacterium]|nr:ABC-F family ATP-binding cassette domain-containing protein [Bacillota bacterium]
MILLTAENIKKSYTEKPLITNVNLSIDSGDKIGLIGVNGTGKSTLLKIIAGAMEAEGGTITKSRDLHMAYLPQNPKYDPEKTIEEQTEEYLRELGGNIQQYECNTMLTKLGIFDFYQKMGELSGGQRKRVAMAAVLASDSNLLILDEPTNHLDSDMIGWLENYLINFKGAVLMITHDRYFLDRIVNRIVEIENGKLYNYDGNYDYYLDTKAARMEMTLATERKRQAIYRKELAWIRRGAQARTTKAKGRIQRFHQLEESKLVIDDTKLELTTASSRLGRKIIEMEGLSKSYGGQTFIRDFSYILLRDDRVGIIGENGCGKSTLLKMIMGEVQPDGGTIEKGDTVKIGYFSQENQVLEEKERVIKFISGIAENVKTSEGSFSASQMLERFLFPPHMHSIEVGRLSGGEKRRLYLLSILMQAPNVLILDEPTNDLDIETLTILEDYLDDFAGAVIVVSHDRYFLDRVVRRTFAFEEGGSIRHYNGGYSDYAARRAEEEADAKAASKTASSGGKTGENTSADGKNQTQSGERTEKPKKLKFTFKEEREYETIEDDITGLELRLEEVENAMGKCGADFVKLGELDREKQKLEETLMEKMERWEYLSDLAARIEEQNEIFRKLRRK